MALLSLLSWRWVSLVQTFQSTTDHTAQLRQIPRLKWSTFQLQATMAGEVRVNPEERARHTAGFSMLYARSLVTGLRNMSVP